MLRPSPSWIVALAALAPILASTGSVEAQGTAVEGTDSARVVDRAAKHDLDMVIVTRSGDVAIGLTGDDLLFQLTDQAIETMRRPEPEVEEESLLAEIVGAMVRAGLTRLIDHAVLLPVSQVRRADYDGERLILEGHDGDLLDISIEDRDVMTDFRPQDARRLVREIHRIQERQTR